MLKLSSFILPMWLMFEIGGIHIPFYRVLFCRAGHQYRVGRIGFKSIFDNVQHASPAVCLLVLLVMNWY